LGLGSLVHEADGVTTSSNLGPVGVVLDFATELHDGSDDVRCLTRVDSDSSMVVVVMVMVGLVSSLRDLLEMLLVFVESLDIFLEHFFSFTFGLLALSFQNFFLG